MNLAFFIARRIARPAPGCKPGVMERIAVISVAVGVAVMILALAVIMGFKREVAHKMEGFAAHVSVTDVRGADALDAEPVRRSAHVEELIRTTEGFRAMAPYAVKGGIVRTPDAVGEVVLKGVGRDYDWSCFREWLVAGELPRVGDSVRTKDILLSQSLADRMLLGVGDKVEMLFVDAGELPRRDRFKVAGIYSSGMEEMDDAVVVTDIRNVQRLSDWAMSVTERYANIFDWLRAHDVNAAVIIVIMLVVAFFNMTSALLILVLERTRMIGLLKALGMGSGQLRRIFLWRAAFVSLRGLAWGNALGIGLCLFQLWTHAVKLDAEGYLLSEVPVSLGWGWWLALNAGFLVAIIALLVIPASVVSRVKPEEAIRYE